LWIIAHIIAGGEEENGRAKWEGSYFSVGQNPYLDFDRTSCDSNCHLGP
jgi:hypothetical protein